VGSLLDQLLGTSPKLMLGLFFLAVVGCFIELVDEVRKMLKGK
jgi:F0F1-type ATP synthase assembly protein I